MKPVYAQRQQTLVIRRMGYALGAEVTGLDLRQPLSPSVTSELRAAWLEHLLLCFPGQDLSEAEFLSFARNFGEAESSFKQNAHPENDLVSLLTNKAVNGKPWDGYKSGQSWHSDKSFTTRPTVATFLVAKEIPAVGGDTIFANAYLAYETLSPAMQRIVDGLSAVHDPAMIKGMAASAPGMAAEVRREHPPTVQPCVREHPETKRKALYLGDRVRKFHGLTDEESRPLLDFLNRHATRYEFTYRHRWHVDDLLMWDNRCTMHLAVCDYHLRDDVRHMLRFATTGPDSGYHYVENGAG